MRLAIPACRLATTSHDCELLSFSSPGHCGLVLRDFPWTPAVHGRAETLSYRSGIKRTALGRVIAEFHFTGSSKSYRNRLKTSSAAKMTQTSRTLGVAAFMAGSLS